MVRTMRTATTMRTMITVLVLLGSIAVVAGFVTSGGFGAKRVVSAGSTLNLVDINCQVGVINRFGGDPRIESFSCETEPVSLFCSNARDLSLLGSEDVKVVTRIGNDIVTKNVAVDESVTAPAQVFELKHKCISENAREVGVKLLSESGEVLAEQTVNI